jgi:hypothetical protein
MFFVKITSESDLCFYRLVGIISKWIFMIGELYVG